jgi:hypothetical protein
MVPEKELTWKNYIRNSNLIECKNSFNHFSDINGYILKPGKRNFVDHFETFLKVSAYNVYNLRNNDLNENSWNVIEKNEKNSSDIEQFVIKIFEISKTINLDVKDETKNIISYFVFEKDRLNTNIVYSKHNLDEQFNLIDNSLALISLKLLKDDVSKIKYLKPLLCASRKHYILHDFPEDIVKGYVNFYEEDLQKHKVSMKDLFSLEEISKKYISSKSKIHDNLIHLKTYEINKRAKFNEELIKNWYHWFGALPKNISHMMKDKAIVGLDQLRSYEKNTLHFKFEARNAFDYLYVKSAKKCLERVAGV